ncbi:hypothetical protein N7526_000203 [Penicillium atrosanguineum]|nr:hypothetical protein N7526_000203 [Penicillium atrosanguineum]
MTVFSLVALPIIFLSLVVRYQKEIRHWLWNRQKKNHQNECAKPPSDLKPQPIKGRERYRVMMDIRKLDAQNWLTLDKNYMDEHRVRDALLREKRDQVIQCLPESVDACHEALEEVSNFLSQRFPNMFETTMYNSKPHIQNRMTGEMFELGGSVPNENLTDALEAAVRLTMEDLSILMRNEDDEYYLAASASLFPTGWTVDQRIGWTISRMHEPVPLWHQQVATSVSKIPLREKTFQPIPDQIIIRRERQTFRRLPRTGAILFGVKTFLTPLDELPMQELENLAKEMETWPENVGEYKGKNVWGAKVKEFYRSRTQVEKVEV